MKQVKIIGTLLVWLVFAGSLGGNYYLWTKYQAEKALVNDPTLASQQEVKNIVAKIGTFMDLPTDEDPSVATVLDISKLKDQPFFKDAQNGDKVVIYSKKQMAILYRPSTNRIIEVAPISLSNPDAQDEAISQTTPSKKTSPSPSPTASPTPSINP